MTADKDALTHLIAISMNDKGFPTALFTVNHWVVGGLWYPAQALIDALDRFVINIPDSQFKITNQWITNMIALFKPQIVELLNLRDKVISDWQTNHPNMPVLQNRELEVTSVMRLET